MLGEGSRLGLGLGLGLRLRFGFGFGLGTDMKILGLDGRWSLRRDGDETSLPARVPGDVCADLLRAKQIPDPFYRENELDVQWVGESNWVYERSFKVSKALLKQERVLLQCEGLDTFATVQINGMTIHPELRGSREYRQLLDTVIACKRAGGRVLGIERYLRGIRDVAAFRCHPLLMPTIRPDASMYYPCLESGAAPVNLLDAGGYFTALRSVHKPGNWPTCRRRCHIFCHMALSLLQRHPVEALSERKYVRN